MSDTPRTENFLFHALRNHPKAHMDPVLTDFARKLERELDNHKTRGAQLVPERDEALAELKQAYELAVELTAALLHIENRGVVQSSPFTYTCLTCQHWWELDGHPNHAPHCAYVIASNALVKGARRLSRDALQVMKWKPSQSIPFKEKT